MVSTEVSFNWLNYNPISGRLVLSSGVRNVFFTTGNFTNSTLLLDLVVVFDGF